MSKSVLTPNGTDFKNKKRILALFSLHVLVAKSALTRRNILAGDNNFEMRPIWLRCKSGVARERHRASVTLHLASRLLNCGAFCGARSPFPSAGTHIMS